MPRFKPVEEDFKLLAVDFLQQVIPGSFEHALCYLVDHEFEHPRKNPYAAQLRKPVIIRLDQESITYFKSAFSIGSKTCSG